MKKNPKAEKSNDGHAKTIADSKLKFSFEYFDCSDTDVCPPVFQAGYTQKLMERLKALSTWTVSEFVIFDKGLRNHKIVWEETARKEGFKHLNAQLRESECRQFALTANEYGRVHGLMIGDTFYIIWLDQNHRLYASA